MATMNDLLNQLVGLCAGRGGLLRLERRKLREEFKNLPDNYEHEGECLSDCQLCTDFVSVSADTGKDFERRSFLKPWEQPDHGITFQRRRKSLDLTRSTWHDDTMEVFDLFGLLQTLPINRMGMPAQESKHCQNFTIPHSWSGEHMASFPPIVLPVPLSLPPPDCCRIGRRASGSEGSQWSLRGKRYSRTDMNSNHIHIEPIAGNRDTRINLPQHTSQPVSLDDFEAKMTILTFKEIKERGLRRDMILGGPENRHRVRIEVDAANNSPEEMEQARQSTTFRGNYGLPYQLPDAGRVHVYMNAHAMKGRGCYRGSMRRRRR
jgi:hypothetical protein